MDSALYENAVWLSSTANAGGLKIANNYYFAQVDSGVLQYMPLANETGWNLTGEYLTTTIGDETFYLRYANGQYHVTSSEAYAGKVMIFEKTTATDVISGSGQTDTKTIYRRVYSFEAGKEYIIVGSSKNPSRAAAVEVAVADTAVALVVVSRERCPMAPQSRYIQSPRSSI